MKRLVYFLFIALPACAFAYEYYIPLSGVTGTYSYGISRTAVFDAGVTFSSINSVHLILAGHNSPGLCNGVECPLHYCYGYLATRMYPDPADTGCYWYTYGAQGAGQYNDYLSFDYTDFPACPTGSWDFLLDGTGQITLSFTHPASFCNLLQSGSATVTQATLIIDALAPGLRVLNPLQSQMLPAGSVCQIQWQDMDDESCLGDYQLEYSTDGGQNWTSLASVEQLCTYDWTVPDIASSNCYIKLLKNDGSGLETIRGPFYIYPCQVDIPGDFVKDCYINSKDLQVMADNWLTSVECPFAVDGDMNNDCHVNLDDLALFAQKWMVCINPFDSTCI